MAPNDINKTGNTMADGRSIPTMQAPQPIPGMTKAPVRQHQQTGQNAAYPQQTVQNGYQTMPNQPYAYQQGYAQQGGYPQQMQYPNQQTGNNWSWNNSAYAPQGYQPVQTPPPASPVPQSGGNGGSRRLDVKWLLIAAAAVVAIVLLVTGVSNASQTQQQANELQQYVQSYNDRFVPGVYVDGIHLGGMTWEEARQTVQEQAQQRADEWYISLETDNGHGGHDVVAVINAATLGMQVDVTHALEAAWEKGHTADSVQGRKDEMDDVAANNFHVATAQPSGSTDILEGYLNGLAASAYLAPQNAVILEFNKNASNPFVIQQEVWGRTLDTAPIKEQIIDMMSSMRSGSIEITPTAVQPDVTAAMLSQNVTLRATAYTAISTTSTENRNKNIIRACELMNGTVIAPGESFSFNGVVGKRTAKRGFYPAIEYAYGEQRDGYGGGVCQVSSTIYIAAVRSGMEITKREQHSQEVNYTTYGLDATVNYDGKVIDFRFRNNTSSNIYIVAKVQFDPKIDKKHDIVRIDIYGEALPTGVKYELEAAVTEELLPNPEPELIQDKEGKYALYTDEMVEKRKASNGCLVDSWRVTYLNGEEVERVHMYTDRYDPKTQQFYVGVNERPLDDFLLN